MEPHVTLETEATLKELARRTRRGSDEPVEEVGDHLVAYNEWFERKVKHSEAAVARGETVRDGEVRDCWKAGSASNNVRVDWSPAPAADVKAIAESTEQDRHLATANRIDAD